MIDIPNIVSTVFYFVLVLSVLVLVHEIGHFIFARRFGVRVEEFGLGYPPRAWTFWKGKGWIQIQGKRIAIPRKFALPAEIQTGSWVTYQTTTENGREVLIGITPVDAESRGLALASQVQEMDSGTRYTLNWLPLGGFVRMTGEENPSDPRSFAAAKPWKRAIILVAGATMNVLLAIGLFTAIAMLGQPKPIEEVTVQAVAPNSPAEGAGLRIGDRVLTIDGTPIKNREDLLRMAYERTGQTIVIEVKRDRDNAVVTLTPRPQPPKGEGPIGITLAYRLIREETTAYPIWEAIPIGVARTFDTGAQIFTGFRKIVQGTAPGSVGGPVQIAQYTGLAAQLGLLRLMEFTALLSVNLAIINLFPFPALDGGRLVFVILEALRGGKRIAPEKEGLVHIVGMAILLMLMLLITVADVQRLFTGG
ncbi:MAG: RIP metalloprotease RseP [Chloroflexota bacterium]